MSIELVMLSKPSHPLHPFTHLSIYAPIYLSDACLALTTEDPLEEEIATHSVFLLENPLDRGACRATVHRVTKSQTRLSNRAHL